MSVWVCLPSARPVEHVNAWAEKWRAQGYKIALWRDHYEPDLRCDLLAFGAYPGYAVAVNRLAKVVLQDTACDWIVATGDDTLPDPSKRADEIAEECTQHFALKHGTWRETFGIMQPTGDRWGEDEPWAKQRFPEGAAYIDRICGSPWIGRQFAQRAYGGWGPLWGEFTHMFVDEHLQAVAKKLGILWQRRDLTHFHENCRRDGVARTPDHLQEAYSSEHWQKSKAIFDRLKSGGFVEACDLLP